MRKSEIMEQKSLFKNTIYKAILSFVNLLIPVLVGSYIVKLLDIELYGAYNKVLSEFQVFLTFASFGIYTYGMREVSKIRDNSEKISILFTNLLVFSFITNFITILIYIIYSILVSSGITVTLYLLMIIQLVGNIFYIEFVNEALENYKFITIKSVVVKIIYMLSLFLFVKNADDIIIYTVIVNLTALLNNVLSFLYAKKKIKFNFKNISIKKYIIPLLTILIISNIELLYSQLDRIMLGKFVSDVSVTMYYIPYYLIAMLTSIPYAIINVSIPRLTYVLENNGKKDYIIGLNKSISSLLFIVIPMCFGVIVLAEEAILLYASEKYIAMVPTLIIACLARIIISIESIMTNLVTYPNNKEKQLLKFSVIFGISNLIMNSILVYFNIFNPSTALVTTAIAELGLALSQYFYAKRKLELNFKMLTKQNITYLITSICFIPISYLIRLLHLNFVLNMVIIIISCVMLYYIVLYLKKDENLLFAINKFISKLKNK